MKISSIFSVILGIIFTYILAIVCLIQAGFATLDNDNNPLAIAMRIFIVLIFIAIITTIHWATKAKYPLFAKSVVWSAVFSPAMIYISILLLSNYNLPNSTLDILSL